MTIRSQVEQTVRERAGDRCEYCRMHQSLQGATFHVEHILPRSQGGDSELDNLAWACPGRNLHKSDRVEADDPESRDTVSRFHPRRDIWTEHFRWKDHSISPVSAVGRATVAALHLNHARRGRIRQAEETFGLFPPEH